MKPPPLSDAEMAMLDDDRAWFATHPGRDYRITAVDACELEECANGVSRTLVCSLARVGAGGIRTRCFPIGLAQLIDADEETARSIAEACIAEVWR